MKTITITKVLFNTIGELRAATKGHQVTAQEIVNERTYVNGQWQDIELGNTLREQFADNVAECLGGQSRTKADVASTLRNGRPQHWGLTRVFLEGTEGNYFWRYCAGQDYVWETNAIRKALK